MLRFERGYYAKLVNAKDNGAIEVLVDPSTGAVWLEPQAMTWNTRYEHMTGNRSRPCGTSAG